MPVNVAVLPESTPFINEAIRATGASHAELSEAQALVWTGSNQNGFPTELPEGVRWVQLKSAGVQPWISSGKVDSSRLWTSAAGAYAEDVAEHAITLLLGVLHQLTLHARASTWLKDKTWTTVRSLRGRTVAIVGAGSIGKATIPILIALGAEVIAINRSGRPVEGATRTVDAAGLNTALLEADDAILAGASTEETHKLIGIGQLTALGNHHDGRAPGVLVNVARGDIIDTESLIYAMQSGTIAGAGLDVFDPEPLENDSPLWSLDNVLITPHIANPKNNMDRSYGHLVADNLQRFSTGKKLRALIDLDHKY